jgi:hypothetical protein
MIGQGLAVTAAPVVTEKQICRARVKLFCEEFGRQVDGVLPDEIHDLFENLSEPCRDVNVVVVVRVS